MHLAAWQFPVGNQSGTIVVQRAGSFVRMGSDDPQSAAADGGSFPPLIQSAAISNSFAE
jgi:hypothetical protein